MPELEYIILFMFLFMIWVVCFLLGGQSWQQIGAFIPISVASYIYYESLNWSWLLLIPLLAIPILDIHIILSKPKFKGLVFYVNYLLIVPWLFLYFIFSDQFKNDDTWIENAFRHLAMCLIIIFSAKFWVSDLLLIFINRLWVKNKSYLNTRINNVYITGTGRSRTFNASIYQLGNVEISGFFYQYVKFKNISREDEIELVIKNGWLGTQYIAGFPKILVKHKQIIVR